MMMSWTTTEKPAWKNVGGHRTERIAQSKLSLCLGTRIGGHVGATGHHHATENVTPHVHPALETLRQQVGHGRFP
jgi:hypothetical protein